jgi:hypothetical protein
MIDKRTIRNEYKNELNKLPLTVLEDLQYEEKEQKDILEK